MNTYNHGKTCLDKIALAVLENITKSRPPAYSPDGKELPNNSKLLWKTKPWDNFECTD